MSAYKNINRYTSPGVGEFARAYLILGPLFLGLSFFKAAQMWIEARVLSLPLKADGERLRKQRSMKWLYQVC